MQQLVCQEQSQPKSCPWHSTRHTDREPAFWPLVYLANIAFLGPPPNRPPPRPAPFALRGPLAMLMVCIIFMFIYVAGTHSMEQHTAFATCGKCNLHLHLNCILHCLLFVFCCLFGCGCWCCLCCCHLLFISFYTQLRLKRIRFSLTHFRCCQLQLHEAVNAPTALSIAFRLDLCLAAEPPTQPQPPKTTNTGKNLGILKRVRMFVQYSKGIHKFIHGSNVLVHMVQLIDPLKNI